MGTLAGHIVPGVCFIIYGVWWSFISIWSHLKRTGSKLSFPAPPQSKKPSSHREYGGNMVLGHAPSFALYKQERRDYELRQRSWLPQPFCTRVPLEPIVKIFCCVVGIMVESVDVIQDPTTSHTYTRLYTTTKSDGTFNDLSQLQHITMYSSFALSGLVDLATLCVRCPDHVSQLFLTLAFLVEGALFHFHTGGMSPLSTQLHTTLTLVIFACSLFALLRVWFPTAYLVNAGLGSFMTLQGTWFVQVGDILYGGRYLSVGSDSEHMESHEHAMVTLATMQAGNATVPTSVMSSRDGNMHNDIMFASALFTWHMMGVALLTVVMWLLVGRMYGCWRRCRSKTAKMMAEEERGMEHGEEEEVEQEKLMEDVTLTRDTDL